MLPVSAEAAAALEARDRTMDARVRVDWDGDGYGGTDSIDNLSPMVGAVTVDRTLVGDLPPQVSIVEGSAAAQADITLDKGPGLADRATIGVRDSAAYGAAVALGFVSLGSLAYSAGDYVLVAIAIDDPDTIMAPGRHWEVLLDQADGSLRLVVYGRFADTSSADAASGDMTWLMDLDPHVSAVGCAVGPTAAHRPGVAGVEAAAAVAEAGSGTSHAGPTTLTERDGCLLLSIGAWLTGTSGTWSPPAGDSELEDVRGTDPASNIALSLAVSTQVAAGSHAKSMTTSASTSTAIVAVIALAPVQSTDERHHAAWYFSPSNGASAVSNKPAVRRPASVDLAVQTAAGVEVVRRLTGYMRGVNPTAAGRTARMQILDRREDLRTLVALPPIEGERYGANASWAVSWALTRCGWTVSPRPRDLVEDTVFGPESSTFLHLPMHGSLWPPMTQGLYSTASDENQAGPDLHAYQAVGGVETRIRPRFVAGPFVLGVHAGALTSGSYTVIRGVDLPTPGERPIDEVNHSGRLELWVRGDPLPDPPPEGDNAHRARVVMTNAPHAFNDIEWQVIVGVATDGAAFFQIIDVVGETVLVNVASATHVPLDGQWHFVGIHWDLDAEEIFFRVDATDEDDTFTTTIAWLDFIARTDLVSYVPIAEVNLNSCLPPPGDPWAVVSTVADATVDPSLLECDVYLERGKREAWGLLQEIAKSEQAVVFCDEAGRAQYRTRARMLDDQMQDVQLTLTAESSIIDINATRQIDSKRNQVEVSYAETYTELAHVYTLPQPVRIAPGDDVEFSATLDASVVELLVMTWVAAAPVPIESYVIFNTQPDGSGTSVMSALGAGVLRLISPGEALVWLANNNTYPVYATELKLAGRAVRIRPTVGYVAANTEARTEPEPLSLPSTQWTQRADVAEILAEQLLAELREPQVQIGSVEVRGDPRLQLCDRVRLVDEHGLAVDSEWWVTAIREEFGPPYRMTIAARQALPVAAWDSNPGWDYSMWAGGEL